MCLIVTISVKGWRQFRPRKGYNIMNKYKVHNKRLAKYLYSLGFERECVTENNKEYWLFNNSDLLQDALIFYYDMRKKNR